MCCEYPNHEFIAEIPEWDMLLKGKATFYLLLSLICCETHATECKMHNLLIFVSHQINYLYPAYEVLLPTGRVRAERRQVRFWG